MVATQPAKKRQYRHQWCCLSLTLGIPLQAAMGGPSGHGQRNKAHKSGNKGLSARQKHRLGKEAGASKSVNVKSGASYAGCKADRALAAKNHRDAKRAELLDKRRRAVDAPLVVAVLPLSHEVDAERLWQNLLNACELPLTGHNSTAADSTAKAAATEEVMMVDAEAAAQPLTATESGDAGMRMCTACVAGKAKLRLTLLPPITPRSSSLAIVDLAKAAEVVLLAVPGTESAQAIDKEGEMALTVLRAIGLPEVALAVQMQTRSTAAGQQGEGHAASLSMKERSAARKRAEKAVNTILAGEHKAFFVDQPTDCTQLVRHLAERPTPTLPHWRQQRPSILVEHADFQPIQAAGADAGQLILTGWVRCAGLSANQLLTVPGAGDFQMDRIEAPTEAQVVLGSPQGSKGGRQEAGAMDVSLQQPVLLAQSDPELAEPLTRENQVLDEDEGEQTWPTAAELAEATQRAMFARRKARRKVPEGTSEYQAAWLVDEEDDEEEEGSGDGDMSDGEAPEAMSDGEGDMGEIPEEEEEAGTDGMAMDDEEADETQSEGPTTRWQRMQAELRARREAEGQDAQYPDEVEVPQGVSARVRFQKYRGLKSFRSSPWDVKEWLPNEYARVFAFENLKRAHKRAVEEVKRASQGTDPSAVTPGTWVRVVLKGVTAQQAAAVTARVTASTLTATPHAAGILGVQQRQQQPPLVCFGLMTHEAKMSVVHFSVTKAASYTDPVANKEELLFVTGLRTFSARPVLSADTPGDKQKMERWLKPGQPTIMSVYAPICYPPLPLLAFKVDTLTGQEPRLAATGSLRGCNPDRIVLKKMTLTGCPVRVHKRRATVKFMFHEPDDIRWFRPVEVYTRAGRRGRITEPLGTHGAMKVLFDGPVQQQDMVCMNLYKRVYPKWPQDNNLTFA